MDLGPEVGVWGYSNRHSTLCLILGDPSCGLLLLGPPCIGGGQCTVLGPVMRNPLEQRSTAKTARKAGLAPPYLRQVGSIYV